MNHAIWKAAGARVIAMAFIIAGAAACDRGDDDRNTTRVDRNGLPTTASPSAQVVGTPPAPPTADTAQTAPTSQAAASEVSKATESTKRPLEGDNHSYSTVAPTTPQKADGVNTTGKN